MTNLAKFVVEVSGWAGGPGVNVVYFSQGTSTSLDAATITLAYHELRACYGITKAYMAPGLNIHVPLDIPIIDVASGEMIDIISVETPESDLVTGTTGGGEARTSQIVVQLRTDVFRNGRLVKGRTFLGPANDGVMDESGHIGSSVRGVIDDAYVAITSGTGPRLAVYSRPSLATSGVGHWADVIQAVTQPVPGVLRSRRG